MVIILCVMEFSCFREENCKTNTVKKMLLLLEQEQIQVLKGISS